MYKFIWNVSEIGLERFLCSRENIFPNFPLTGSQYFTLMVVTHPVETYFKYYLNNTYFFLALGNLALGNLIFLKVICLRLLICLCLCSLWFGLRLKVKTDAATKFTKSNLIINISINIFI